MGTDDLIVMGKIGAAHGVRGEVKIHSFTDPMENLFDYPVWHLRREGEPVKQVRLASARSQGKGLVARFDGLDDREMARTWTGYEICVPRSELPELEEGEYYWHQLVGLEVVNRQQQLLGRVNHLLETGANDVLVVRPSAGSLDGRERLLPYTDECVLHIDLEKGCISVEWDADF